MLDFLFALIELFSLSISVPSYEVKCAQLGCFQRGRPLCTQLLSGQGRPPSAILDIRKLETLGYPVVKNAFFCVSWFDTISECDRQRDGRTDGQTDGYAAHSIHLSLIHI